MSRGLARRFFAMLIVFGCVFGAFSSRDARPNFSDFKVYWVAGEKAAEHRTVYDVQGHYQFKYSPFVALLWAPPAAFLPGTRYHWAWLNYGACGVGWLAVFYVLARFCHPARTLAAWLSVWCVFTIGLRDELKLGQANLWPFLLVLPAWFIRAPSKPRRPGLDALGIAVGAAWGLAVQWKLYALVLGPLWLLRRRVDVALGALAVTALTLGPVLALAHGWPMAMSENVRWLQSLTASSEYLLISEFNVSVIGVLGKWTGVAGGPVATHVYVVWAALAAAWAVTLVWAERDAVRRAQPFFTFWSASWAWAGIVVLNPLVWPYWLLFCAPLYVAYLSDVLATGLRATDFRFWSVSGWFTLMNWMQNSSFAHQGGALSAVLLLQADAFARAYNRDRAQLAQLSQLRLSATSTPA